jgi:bifunctional non-homologous end joining protein LigD
MLPAGFVAPCLPTKTHRPPSGPDWLHEVKHDGFRVIARKSGNMVRLYSRPGNDLTGRFRTITQAVARLRVSSCIIDGEAVAFDANGVPSFDRLRDWRSDRSVFMCAFDLLEIDGDDFRPQPIERRKIALAKLVARANAGIQLCEHIEEDGRTVFEHACRLGLEGIVSKRRGSRYSSGRFAHWLKCKNPDSAAAKREAEEDWGLKPQLAAGTAHRPKV